MTIFLFWEEDWELEYNSMDFWDFRKSYAALQLVSELVFTILVIITFRFICYEKNIWNEIYKFPNLISTVASLRNGIQGVMVFLNYYS